MKTWLCTGKKPDIPKCINSEVEIKEYSGVWGNLTYHLVVYCKAKHKFVQKYITMCDDYNNRNLMENETDKE